MGEEDKESEAPAKRFRHADDHGEDEDEEDEKFVSGAALTAVLLFCIVLFCLLSKSFKLRI